MRKERKKEQKKAVIYEPVLASRPAKAVIYEPVLVARPVVRFRRERPRGPSAAAFTMGAFERVPVFTLKTLSGARSQPRRGIEPAKNWQRIANFFEDHSANLPNLLLACSCLSPEVTSGPASEQRQVQRAGISKILLPSSFFCFLASQSVILKLTWYLPWRTPRPVKPLKLCISSSLQ